LRIRGIATLTACKASWDMVFWGISMWLPTFLVMGRGFSESEVAWAAALPYVGYIAGLLVGGHASDRARSRATVTAAFCMIGAAALLIVNFAQGREVALIALGGLFFCISLLGPNVLAMLQGVCGDANACSATGVVNGVSNGSAAAGPVVFGGLAAAMGSFDAALPLMAAMMVLSGAGFLWFRRHEVGTCPAGGE